MLSGKQQNKNSLGWWLVGVVVLVLALAVESKKFECKDKYDDLTDLDDLGVKVTSSYWLNQWGKVVFQYKIEDDGIDDARITGAWLSLEGCVEDQIILRVNSIFPNGAPTQPETEDFWNANFDLDDKFAVEWSISNLPATLKVATVPIVENPTLMAYDTTLLLVVQDKKDNWCYVATIVDGPICSECGTEASLEFDPATGRVPAYPGSQMDAAGLSGSSASLLAGIDPRVCDVPPTVGGVTVLQGAAAYFQPYAECLSAPMMVGVSEETPGGTIEAVEELATDSSGDHLFHVRLVQNVHFNDVTWGTGLSSGWDQDKGRPYGKIVHSDRTEFEIYDTDDKLMVSFEQWFLDDGNYEKDDDDIGYTNNMGLPLIEITGGNIDTTGLFKDGTMYSTSSGYRNFRTCNYPANPYSINSPATDNNWTPNPATPYWDYRVVQDSWLDLEVLTEGKTRMPAKVNVTYLHASPSKLGSGTMYVTFDDCPPCVAGEITCVQADCPYEEGRCNNRCEDNLCASDPCVPIPIDCEEKLNVTLTVPTTVMYQTCDTNVTLILREDSNTTLEINNGGNLCSMNVDDCEEGIYLGCLGLGGDESGVYLKASLDGDQMDLTGTSFINACCAPGSPADNRPPTPPKICTYYT